MVPRLPTRGTTKESLVHAFVAFGGLCVFLGFSLALISWYKQRQLPLAIIFAISGIVIGSIIWGVAAASHRQCEEIADKVHLEFEHSLLTGCWLYLENVPVNSDWLRIVP